MIKHLFSNVTKARGLLRLATRQPVWPRLKPVQMTVGPRYMFSDEPKQQDPENPNIPKLMTIPQGNQKVPASYLTPKEAKQKPEEFCLFSSAQPIFPYNSMSCQLKLGNLKEINHKIMYCMQSGDTGDIYTVGLVLDRSVETELKKQIKALKDSDRFAINQAFTLQILCRPNSYRVRLTEVTLTQDGVFAKGVPFKDNKLTPEEESFNIEAQIEQIQQMVNRITQTAMQDRIEIFKDFKLKLFNEVDVAKPETIDQLVYQIIASISPSLQLYTKESTSKFLQTILESRNHIERVMLLKRKLRDVVDALDIVSRNFRQAENSMQRHQSQQLAKIATEYIKQTYLKDIPYTGSGQPLASSNPAPAQASYSGTNPLLKKYYEKLTLLDDPVTKEKVKKEVDRFATMDKQQSEYAKLNQYLDEIFSIPWRTYTPVMWDVDHAKKVLDKEIFGLEKVKERIIEMISVNKLKCSDEKSKGFIILLNGPPGVGKTSIAKVVAQSLKRQSRFISFAGVSDPHFFKGHRRTYVDSQPGVFIKELIKANTLNPVFILDEVDKIGRSNAGADPYYQLLEILNPDENHNFSDHYLDISVDFSKVIFILTSNSTLQMLEPLFNRLEIIDVPSYIDDEKVQICKEYVIPKVLESNGLTSEMIVYNDETIKKIIKAWCYYESGVRDLKRQLEKIARKHVTDLVQTHPDIFEKLSQPQQPEIVEEDQDKLEVSQRVNKEAFSRISSDERSIKRTQIQLNLLQNIPPLDLTKDIELDVLQKYLGPPQFDAVAESRVDKNFPAGQLNILTVGGSIGNVLILECQFDKSDPEKKGQLTSSGNLQQVLQESLKLAKINAAKYFTDEELTLMSKSNIHVHFLNGAVPKDGPSAGTAICTALISLIRGKTVPAYFAMTGEISLNGMVCKIGGIQQKLIAAKTLGITDVCIPKTNLGDVLALTSQLLNNMNLYFVERYDQIFSLVFEEKLQAFRNGDKLEIEGLIVVKDGSIVTTSQNPIYKNYEAQV